MSFDNRISLRVTAADQKKINEALKTAQETLKPYLVALTTEERRTLPKMSDRTTPFVEKALGYAQTNPLIGAVSPRRGGIQGEPRSRVPTY